MPLTYDTKAPELKFFPTAHLKKPKSNSSYDRRSVGVKPRYGAQEQNFIIVRQLMVCWCGVLSLMRGRACHLQLPLAVASTVIIVFESFGTHGYIRYSSNLGDQLVYPQALGAKYSDPPLRNSTTHNRLIM
jgi:hypothetical protein